MGKTYMPQNMLNNNWSYEFNNDGYYVIHTRNNCYWNYNTEYCDCYKVYPEYDYLQTNAFACYNGSYASLNYNDFTTDYNYRIDIWKIYLLFAIICVFGIIIPFKIISRVFGRWLKV